MIRVRQSERGGALLTVLLLVAVMSALSVAALERLRLSTRLAANGAADDQARAYAMAAAAMALERTSLLTGRSRDHRKIGSGWNGRPITLPREGGSEERRDGKERV